MPAEFIEADAKREAAALGELLGDTRVRFHRRETPPESSEQLMNLDREIRQVLAQPLSTGLQLEIRGLTARLRALDPR